MMSVFTVHVFPGGVWTDIKNTWRVFQFLS